MKTKCRRLNGQRRAYAQGVAAACLVCGECKVQEWLGYVCVSTYQGGF